MRYIQARFEEHAAKLNSELALEKPKTVMEIAVSILPRDDSSLQWSEPNGGFTDDPAATLEQLYTRLVEKLKPAYGKVLNILNKMPVQKDFVTEQDAQKFSEQLAQETAKHPQ
jgi:hypothetical protein